MERNVISWTAENWITVVLMCFVGFAVLGIVGRLTYSVAGSRDA